MIVSVVFFLRQSRMAHLTAINKACRNRLDLLLVILFTVPLNLPDSKILGSIPANATSFLGWLNRSISPISEIIVAAIFSSIPGIDWIILYSFISFAKASISSSNVDRCFCYSKSILMYISKAKIWLWYKVSWKGFRSAAAISFFAFVSAHLWERLLHNSLILAAKVYSADASTSLDVGYSNKVCKETTEYKSPKTPLNSGKTWSRTAWNCSFVWTTIPVRFSCCLVNKKTLMN